MKNKIIVITLKDGIKIIKHNISFTNDNERVFTLKDKNGREFARNLKYSDLITIINDFRQGMISEFEIVYF